MCEAPRLRETGWRDTHTPLPVCVTCWGLSSYTVCADECRSGHTLCGPVPMGTAVIANSLFLWFLAVLPLLEYWQALGRSDMQNLCQVGFMWKECFLFDFLLCVSKATLSYSVTRLRWNSTFFLVFFSFHLSLIKRRLCFRARSTPQADRLNLLLRVHNPPLKVDARSVLVKWLQVSVTRLCTLGRQTLGFASDLSVSRREFHTSRTGKCVLGFF